MGTSSWGMSCAFWKVSEDGLAGRPATRFGPSVSAVLPSAVEVPPLAIGLFGGGLVLAV